MSTLGPIWVDTLSTKVLGVGVLVLAASGCLPAPLVYIDTFAGNGEWASTGDGGPAVEAATRPTDVATDAVGNVYFAEQSTHRVRRIGLDGIITTIAGNGDQGFSGDGGPATHAKLSFPTDVAIDAEGNLYIADSNNGRIRRVGTDGIITTVVGVGPIGFSGDGGPATEAQINFIGGIALSNDGTLYLSDTGNHRIRRVGVDGIISTIAGKDEISFTGDGGPAVDATLSFPAGIEVDDAGNIYFADQGNYRVRRIDPNGLISTVAGNGATYGPPIVAGSRATEIPLGIVVDVALEPEGRLLIGTLLPAQVLRVSLEHNRVAPVAGTGEDGFNGDGGPAVDAQLRYLAGIASSPSGDIYISDAGNDRVRVLRTGGSIGGFVRVDTRGRAGLTVRLYDSDDRSTPIATAITGDFGIYGFTVVPGEYVIEFVGTGTRAGEWWNNADDAESAQVITITRGTQHKADAALAAR